MKLAIAFGTALLLSCATRAPAGKQPWPVEPPAPAAPAAVRTPRPRPADAEVAARAAACRAGSGPACRRLEELLDADDTAPSDFAPSIAALRTACDLRVTDGCVTLASAHAYALGVPEWRRAGTSRQVMARRPGGRPSRGR